MRKRWLCLRLTAGLVLSGFTVATAARSGSSSGGAEPAPKPNVAAPCQQTHDTLRARPRPAIPAPAYRLEGGEIQHEAAAHSAFGQPSMRLCGLVGR